MQRKSEVHELFTMLQNLFNYCIKMFQSDGDREFDNAPRLSILKTWDLLLKVLS